MEWFEVLQKDHIEIGRMLITLETTTITENGDLIDLLRTKVSEHEAFEEEYLWEAVRQLVPDGDRLADEAAEQERTLHYLLSELIGVRQSEGLITKLISASREHMAFEENQVWPELRKVISADRRVRNRNHLFAPVLRSEADGMDDRDRTPRGP